LFCLLCLILYLVLSFIMSCQKQIVVVMSCLIFVSFLFRTVLCVLPFAFLVKKNLVAIVISVL
jgi:hypothetical protein